VLPAGSAAAGTVTAVGTGMAATGTAARGIRVSQI
jgi:hypothetical protein